MSGAVLIELGHPTAGRERQALELVNAFLAHVDALLDEGAVEAFRWYGLEDGDLNRRAAIIALEGSPQQLDALSASDEFRELRYCAPSFLQSFTIVRARPPDRTNEAPVLTRAFERWGLLDP